jgi:ABC-type siderophore export system fused ATPase/permease subunit
MRDIAIKASFSWSAHSIAYKITFCSIRYLEYSSKYAFLVIKLRFCKFQNFNFCYKTQRTDSKIEDIAIKASFSWSASSTSYKNTFCSIRYLEYSSKYAFLVIKLRFCYFKNFDFCYKTQSIESKIEDIAIKASFSWSASSTSYKNTFCSIRYLEYSSKYAFLVIKLRFCYFWNFDFCYKTQRTESKIEDIAIKASFSWSASSIS